MDMFLTMIDQHGNERSRYLDELSDEELDMLIEEINKEAESRGWAR
jgi:hypothetical protein